VQAIEASAEAPAGGASNKARVRWALAGLALSTLMPSLDTSIANVGLPTLAREFGASFQQVQWVVLAYLLAVTALIVSVGRLGDLVGRRRLLLAGIGLFTLASLLCGIAPNLGLLVAARAAQGVGAAVMMALALALARETAPAARTGAAMGLLGTMSAIGTTLGPSLGGVLIASFGWRSMFLINVPIGLVTLLLAARGISRDRLAGTSKRSGVDAFGTLLLTLTLAAYALALTTGGGRLGADQLALLAAAAAAGLLFLLAQARARSPLLPLALFRDAAFSAGLATSLLVSTVMMATLVVGPFYLSRALGLDPVRVGLAMSAGPLVAALFGVPAGQAVDRFGARRAVAMGLAGMTAGLAALAAAPARFGLAGYLAAIAVVTAHYALFQAANNSLVVGGASSDRRGLAAGMLSLSRNLGLLTGVSAMGAVFASASGAIDLAVARPDAVAAGMRLTYAVAALLVLVALVVVMMGRALARHPSPAPARQPI
jgi:EmrB/QacA subfamily drug resistance transporter